MRRLAAALLAVVVGGLLGDPGLAQEDLSMGQVRSPVLTIDVDRLLAETLYGQRLGADLQARGEALAAENTRIFAELSAEEARLTERRPGMDPDDFRSEADAFDARVQRIRAEQDAKERALNEAVTEGRAAFLEAVTPALGGLMIDSGAAVILDRRDVFLSASAVDVTEDAIAAIDAEVGEGAPPAPPAEPGLEDSPSPNPSLAPEVDGADAPGGG